MLTIDESRFPLVVIESRDAVTDADVDDFLAYLDQQIAEQRHFGVAFQTLTKLSVPKIALIKRIAAWNKENGDDLARVNVCVGMNLSSAALRGSFRFLNSLSRSSIPQETFSTWDETVAWVLENLRKEGLIA